MLNKNFFGKLLSNHQAYYKLREEALHLSRGILRLSKQAIFALHKDDSVSAEKALKQAEKSFSTLEELFKKDKDLSQEGFVFEASEEFIEAKLFFEFLKNGKVDIQAKPEFSTESYLGGICDFTGEVLRKAVQMATKGKTEKVLKYLETCQEVMGELIKFDLTGKLRYKYDEAKRNMKKIEEIMYEIKIREK